MSHSNNPMDPQFLFSSAEAVSGDEDDYLPLPATWSAAPVPTQPPPYEEIRSTACDAIESPEFSVLTQESKLAVVTMWVLCLTSHSRACHVGKLWHFCGIKSPHRFAAVLAELESARWIVVEGEMLLPRPFGDQRMLDVSFPDEILPLAQTMVSAYADLRVTRRFS